MLRRFLGFGNEPTQPPRPKTPEHTGPISSAEMNEMQRSYAACLKMHGHFQRRLAECDPNGPEGCYEPGQDVESSEKRCNFAKYRIEQAQEKGIYVEPLYKFKY